MQKTVVKNKNEQSLQTDGIFAGGLTKAEFDALKKKYGNLRLVTLKTKEGDKHFWFKKEMGMSTLGAYTKLLGVDPVKACQIIFNDQLVVGDNDAANNAGDFAPLMKHLYDLVDKAETEVKEF